MKLFKDWKLREPKIGKTYALACKKHPLELAVSDFNLSVSQHHVT